MISQPPWKQAPCYSPILSSWQSKGNAAANVIRTQLRPHTTCQAWPAGKHKALALQALLAWTSCGAPWVQFIPECSALRNILWYLPRCANEKEQSWTVFLIFDIECCEKVRSWLCQLRHSRTISLVLFCFRVTVTRKPLNHIETEKNNPQPLWNTCCP